MRRERGEEMHVILIVSLNLQQSVVTISPVAHLESSQIFQSFPEQSSGHEALQVGCTTRPVSVPMRLERETYHKIPWKH